MAGSPGAGDLPLGVSELFCASHLHSPHSDLGQALTTQLEDSMRNPRISAYLSVCLSVCLQLFFLSWSTSEQILHTPSSSHLLYARISF
jgi:hypothetical protein